MEKPVLINGFGRSGTTYLFFQLHYNYPGKVIYEPLNPSILRILQEMNNLKITHPYFSNKVRVIRQNYIELYGEKIFEIIKDYHPNLNTHHRILYNITELENYLKHFKGLHIKETVLFFYLNSNFIKDNWRVFHIIRHTIDTYISWLKAFGIKDRKLFKLNKLRFVFKILSKFINYKFTTLHMNFEELCNLFPLKRTIFFEEIFLAVWTLCNYHAIRSIPKRNVIVYEKPETYRNLPFTLQERLRIKIYPEARESLQYKFERIAKKIDVDYEYNSLLKLFD